MTRVLKVTAGAYAALALLVVFHNPDDLWASKLLALAAGNCAGAALRYEDNNPS